MIRRKFLASAAAAAAATIAPLSFLSTAHAASSLDPVLEIKKLRISSGPLTGGYLVAPAGRVNWYFTNLGLLPLISRLSPSDLALYIRPYLELYLSNLQANTGIMDFDLPAGPNGPIVPVASDSDDSYAATFLSLACRYTRASGDMAWWDARKSRLKDIAYGNLATTAKPTGLTSVFQSPRSSSNSLGYMMDNCEAYRGLRDFSAMLAEHGDGADANYYGSFATAMGAGIDRELWMPAQSAFRASDGDAAATTSFYPGATCQVFPQAFGVAEASAHFDAAWRYFNATAPNWQSGSLDPFPWAVLGFVAAVRGDWLSARAQLGSIDTLFVQNRGMVTINELGFYLRSVNVLSGRFAV